MCVNIWSLIVGTDSCKIIVKFICDFFFICTQFRIYRNCVRGRFGGFLLRALLIVCQVFWPFFGHQKLLSRFLIASDIYTVYFFLFTERKIPNVTQGFFIMLFYCFFLTSAFCT